MLPSEKLHAQFANVTRPFPSWPRPVSLLFRVCRNFMTESVLLTARRLFSMLATTSCISANTPQLLGCVVHPWNTRKKAFWRSALYTLAMHPKNQVSRSLSSSCPAAEQAHDTLVKLCPSPWDPGDKPHSQNSALLLVLVKDQK